MSFFRLSECKAKSGKQELIPNFKLNGFWALRKKELCRNSFRLAFDTLLMDSI